MHLRGTPMGYEAKNYCPILRLAVSIFALRSTQGLAARLASQHPRRVHSVRVAVFAAAERSGASLECPPRVARAPQQPVAHVSRWPVATPHRVMIIAIVHCSGSAEALTVHFLAIP